MGTAIFDGMPEVNKNGSEPLRNLLLWLLVLLPAAGCARLVWMNSVDQRFLDDWAWARDAVKYVNGAPPGGTSLLHDLFSVHLEHRPALARALALFATVWAGGDVRSQDVLTFAFVGLSFAALCRLWLKRGGTTIRDAWLPLLLASAVMFSPVQWQTFLWPICVGTVMPAALLLLSLCVALNPWPWWARCLSATGLAALGMVSFASGTLAWILPLPVHLCCGAFASRRQRWGFVALWGAMLALTLALYFQPRVVARGTISEKQTLLLSLPGHFDLVYDLHNEALPQYAYHQGEEDTMAGALPYFLSHPLEDASFVAAFSGAFLSRGWAANTVAAATTAGCLLLAGLGLLAFASWRARKDPKLLGALLPMLCLGAYTPITGLMVAVGRIHAGHIGTALNVRYHAHQTQILVALVGAAYFLGRHSRRDHPDSRRCDLAWLGSGILAGIIGLGWIFGASMMSAWKSARLRNSAGQLVSQIFSDFSRPISWVAGSQRITTETTDALDKAGLLKRRPLRDNRLASLAGQLRISERTLSPGRAMVHRLRKGTNRHWTIDGYALLPVSHRPADGLVLAYRVPGGEWLIWGFTQPQGPPPHLARSLGKDLWGIVPGKEPWPPHVMCPLEKDVVICEQPPAGAQISVWVMDMARRALHRVTRSNEGRPDEDGLSLEELAKDHEPDS